MTEIVINFPRPLQDRQALIDEAKELYTLECEKYIANDIQENMDVRSLETFDIILNFLYSSDQKCIDRNFDVFPHMPQVCSLAYFHDVLVGDGNSTSSSASEGVYVQKTELPLWKAIKMAKSYTEKEANPDIMKKASSKQITGIDKNVVESYFVRF